MHTGAVAGPRFVDVGRWKAGRHATSRWSPKVRADQGPGRSGRSSPQRHRADHRQTAHAEEANATDPRRHLVPTPVLPGKPIHLQVADQPTPVVNDALDARPEWFYRSFYRVPDRPDPGELGGTAMKGHVARKRDRYYAVTYEGMTPSTARRGRAGPLPAPTALKPKPSPPASRPNATAATRRSARSPSAPTSRVDGS